ncbi:ATP synthase subunit s, mitochondrial [Orussus abietinus]|uniref:ATP synthase subunit s, mitochondrial n=1 Tax=Orussus abietinus TaxID=222816 RepID=UPI000624FE29|nr:ATP synthase subunit s, mitochondrial [Orussus abietinus]
MKCLDVKNVSRALSIRLPNKRTLFHWVTLVFNRVDEERLAKLGPDRACAEWLLRNGAAVLWKNSNEYMADYNSLPPENQRFYIQAVDATDSAIHHSGFQHFRGCKFIEDVKLIRCSYVEDEALPKLSFLKTSLTHLEILDCANVTEEGLFSLKNLSNLKVLKLGGMPYVKNKDTIMDQLTKALPQCKLKYD